VLMLFKPVFADADGIPRADTSCGCHRLDFLIDIIGRGAPVPGRRQLRPQGSISRRGFTRFCKLVSKRMRFADDNRRGSFSVCHTGVTATGSQAVGLFG
jgi:hypothetical protein